MMEKLKTIVEEGQKLVEKRAWLLKGYATLVEKINIELAKIQNTSEKQISYLLREYQFVENAYETYQRKVHCDLVFEGGAPSIASPREVFRFAISKAVASIILCHNHPSGDPEPSREDISISRRLIQCGNLLAIKVLDHIIIGKGDNYYSMKEKSFINFSEMPEMGAQND